MNKQTAKFYNFFSGLYPIVDLFLKPQKERLIQEVNNFPMGNLLEIGVGNGSHLHLYKKHSITGIDISEKMLEYAKNQRVNNIKLFRMNGEELEFKNESFNYVVLSHVIAVADNSEKILEEVYRVLKPQGKLIILNHFTPDNWLKYIDRAFNHLSTLLYFKSAFYMHSLKALNHFKLEKKIELGKSAYYKLLILSKP